MAKSIARGSEPTAGEAERSGEQELGGFSPTTKEQFASAASAMNSTNVPSLQAPAENILRVSRCARRMESISFPAVASRLQDKPSAADSGGVAAAAPLANRFVARGSELSARQTDRSG
jgi:hypothetical protein